MLIVTMKDLEDYAKNMFNGTRLREGAMTLMHETYSLTDGHFGSMQAILDCKTEAELVALLETEYAIASVIDSNR